MPENEHPVRARYVYAMTLRLMVPAAFSLVALAFLMYVTGVLEPLVPLAEVPDLWKLGAGEVLEKAGLAPGWGWATQWRMADTLCLLCLAVLAAATPVACFAVAVQYARRREWWLAATAAVQALILGLAMSGLVVAH